jgi:hypothetical protein
MLVKDIYNLILIRLNLIDVIGCNTYYKSIKCVYLI